MGCGRAWEGLFARNKGWKREWKYLFTRNMGCGRAWEGPATWAADKHGKVCSPCGVVAGWPGQQNGVTTA
eukprot:11047132-Prorocentrum_lima.AAC.1